MIEKKSTKISTIIEACKSLGTFDYKEISTITDIEEASVRAALSTLKAQGKIMALCKDKRRTTYSWVAHLPKPTPVQEKPSTQYTRQELIEALEWLLQRNAELEEENQCLYRDLSRVGTGAVQARKQYEDRLHAYIECQRKGD